MLEKSILEQSEVMDKPRNSDINIKPYDRSKYEAFLGDDRLDKEGNLEKDMEISIDKKFLQLLDEFVIKRVDGNKNNLDQDIEVFESKKLNEADYKLDDNGKEYKDQTDNKLVPNNEYTVNGYSYETDDKGRIVHADGELKRDDDVNRNLKEQREAGGEDRREGDDGGHLFARIFGGSEGIENLVPMRRIINRGDYKKMESEIAKALDEGKKVEIKIDIKYKDDSARPDKINVEYYIDGKKTEVSFENKENSTELLSEVKEKISTEDYDSLQEELQDMKNDGHYPTITSVKTEYDENGSPEKVVVGLLDETTGEKTYKTYNVNQGE